jgi:hypothetical protein
LASNAPEDYQVLLTTLADACCNERVSALVHSKFPGTRRAPYGRPFDPVERARQEAAGGPGEFTPRSVGTGCAKEANSPIVLAFIPGWKGANASSILAAKASQMDKWRIVEREEVDKVLTERAIKSNDPFGSAELSAVAYRLVADVIVRTSGMELEKETVCCLEAFSVRTGLPFDRFFIPMAELKSEPFCSGYLSRISTKLAAVDESGPLAGISLLKISAESGCPGGNTLANKLQVGILQAIDDTPGLIALTREQMEPISSEKALKDSGGLWGAAWTMEGGVKGADGGRVTLTLRLSSLGDNKTSHTIVVEGSPTGPRTMVANAWKQAAAFMDRKPAGTEDPEKRAAAEAARLLREAEWIANGPRPWEGVPAADAAYYLGADLEKTLMVRMKCHWNTRHVWNPREQWGSIYYPDMSTGFPIRPEFHDYARRWIGEYLELGRIISESLDRMVELKSDGGAEIDKNTLESFWNYAEGLARFHAMLVPMHLDSGQREMFACYENELVNLVRRLIPITVDRFGRYFGNRFLMFENITQHFRRLPSLGESFAVALLRRKPATVASTADCPFDLDSFSNDCDLAYWRAEIVADLLDSHLAKTEPSALIPLRRAEIAILRGRAPTCASDVRQMLFEYATYFASTRVLPGRLIGWKILNRYLPYAGNRDCSSQPDVLVALDAAPRPAPDFLIHPEEHIWQRWRYLSASTPDSPHWCFDFSMRQTGVDSEFKSLVRAGAPREKFDFLLDRVQNNDRLLGSDFATNLASKIEKEIPKSIQRAAFGSKKQFGIVNPEAAVQATVLTDLCKGVVDGNAVIVRSMIDPADRNLLWIVLHELPERDLTFPDVSSVGPDGSVATQQHAVKCKAAWLVAIDCRDGRIIRKTDLFKAAGLDPTTAGDFRELGQFLGAHVAFNRISMLMEIRNADRLRHLMVERESGKASLIPGITSVLNFQLVQTDGTDNPAMIGIGNEFYLIENTFKGKYNSMGLHQTVVWQIKPDGKPLKLSYPGRRPVESPFDDDDRRPCLLRVDDGKALVASSWEHLACFDPAGGKWETPPQRDGQAWAEHVREIDTRDFQATLFPQHQLEMDGKTCYFGGSRHSTPGHLAFCVGTSGKYESRLPVSLAPPAANQSGFVVSGPIPSDVPGPRIVPERVSLADLARSHMACPVILNQTATHIVLGLRFTAIASPILPLKHPAMLPFIWVVDKKTATEAVMARCK